VTIAKIRAPVDLLAPGRGPIRVLRGALLVMVGLLVAVAVRNMIAMHPVGVDLEIPLRAARRWLDGGQPYLPESFQAGLGYDLPFLYPPFVLPLVAPLLALPRPLVTGIWLGLIGVMAVWACRRLAIPWRWVPLVLLWPPFFEALLGGNVQLVLFAAFAGLMFARPGRIGAWHPVDRDPGDGDRPTLADGLLGVVNGALKVSQVHPWVLLLRRRPRAALLGAAVVVAIIVATLPLTGIELWFDWLAQLDRAHDPGWPWIGSSFTQYLPRPLGLGVTVATIGLAFAVPRRHAGAWLGILMVVGGPSLRIFGLLFLLPSMLLVRRECALIAAFLVTTYMFSGIWLAVIIVAGTLALGLRYPALLEPVPKPS
jgi:hypothetical protein